LSPGKYDEFEATHSLEEIKRMARTLGISPDGTKRDIITRLPKVKATGSLKVWDAVDRKKLSEYCAQVYGVPVTPEASDYFVRIMDRLIDGFKDYLPLHLVNRRGLTRDDMYKAASRYF